MPWKSRIYNTFVAMLGHNRYLRLFLRLSLVIFLIVDGSFNGGLDLDSADKAVLASDISSPFKAIFVIEKNGAESEDGIHAGTHHPSLIRFIEFPSKLQAGPVGKTHSLCTVHSPLDGQRYLADRRILI
jgi:hypothetical protein